MLKPAPLIAVLLAAAVAVAAGCGGGDGSSSSPLGNALGYLPANSAFAVAIETDGDRLDDAEDLAEELRGGRAQLGQLIERALGERADDLEQIEKALGNPFVVGSTDTREFLADGEDRAFVGAIQARDEGALQKLVEGDRAKEDGEVAGATVYVDDSGDPFAIDGDTLVVAGDRGQLEMALEAQDAGEGLSEEDFETATEGLPSNALVRVYLNVAELLLADPDAKQALRSKWVAALRTGGIALALDDDAVAVDVNLATDSKALTDADLPIASGGDAPEVLAGGAGNVNIALRDPAQLLEFAQATAKAVDPDGFSDFERGRAQVERRLRIDLEDDLIAQLDGDLALTIARDGKFGARAELSDPDALRATLKKLEPVLPEVASGIAGQRVGFSAPKGGDGLYAVATGDGDQVVFGIVDDVLVVANSQPLAERVAEQGTRAIPGASGALVLETDPRPLLGGLLGQASKLDVGPEGLADQVTGELGKQLTGSGSLGTLTGAVEASTERLTARFRLDTDDD